MERILVSRCLLGENVRYDGGDALLDHPLMQQWQREGRLVSICPELAGGLNTPRAPAEIHGGQGLEVISGKSQVNDNLGNDVTPEFLRGAKTAAELCRQHKIRLALLKSKSPSCGNQSTYDGSFKGQLIDGEGVTAATLQAMGIHVFNEDQLDELAIYLQQLASE